MSSPVLSACKRLGVLLFSSVALGSVGAEAAFHPQGQEYPIGGLLRGDQLFSHVSLGQGGGYVVWQDNATDGDGYGVKARRLGGSALGTLGEFRVNQQGAGDQERPKVALLKNQGAVIVWQGGAQNHQDIFARFISAEGVFSTGDIRVNSYVTGQQSTPSVAVLGNGAVLVVWSSYGQDGSMQGIFGQWLSGTGEKIGGEFQINQYSAFNQRTPVVAALGNGQAVVAWVSEQNRFENSVDVYARILGGGREAQGNEFLVNADSNVSANPAVAGTANGFLITWSTRNPKDTENGWDVVQRPFTAKGVASGNAVRVNQHSPGNHYAPQLAGVGDDFLLVWTSVGQDGSAEGVFGRYVTGSGGLASAEFQVNSWAGGQQIYPTAAADGAGQYVVVWSSFNGGVNSFDLLAQRYSPVGLAPTVPWVAALSSTKLSVTWPDAGARNVTGYELHIDGNPPVVVQGNIWTISGLTAASSHSIRLAYRFSDGSASNLSAPVLGTTWGSDENLDGLPDDWQSAIWGGEPGGWPDARLDSDSDGASNLQEFMAGTDPRDGASVLRTSLVVTEQGTFLNWNTQAGFVYQVQSASDVSQGWTDVGSPRFAAGATDSLLVNAAGDSVYYRVKRLR